MAKMAIILYYNYEFVAVYAKRKPDARSGRKYTV